MPEISMLIPFRDSTGERSRLIKYLVPKWQAHMPDAEIIVASDDGDNPFSKTIAVNNAYKQATTDILIMMDADCWVQPNVLRKGADIIKKRRAPWVRPCNKVLRINKNKTDFILQQNYLKRFPHISKDDCDRITPVVGLVAMFTREGFEDIGGMDPRFRGWGWEDNAFNSLMDSVYGKHLLMNYPVYHLWHPRFYSDNNKPVWEGQDKRNNEIGTIYKRNRRSKTAMLNLAKEVQELTGIKPPQ